MSKHRKNNTEELHPASDQECVLNNHDDVFKPFDNSNETSLRQDDSSDTATDPITSGYEGDASEHRIEFVMKMPDCVVDPESREKVIRYFQQQAGGTYCWQEVGCFLETAKCIIDEEGNPHFSNRSGTLKDLTLQETIEHLDWAWRNSLYDVLLQSGMVNLNVKPQ